MERVVTPEWNSLTADPPGPTICVLATSVEGTDRALASAQRLIRGLAGARIVLLVAKPRARANGAAWRQRMDRYYDLASRLGVEVMVLTCVCERLDDAVRQLVGPSSLLVIGGRRPVWWPSREARLVDRLTARGYLVVFADMRGAQVTDSTQPTSA